MSGLRVQDPANHLLFCKGAIQQPCHDGEVFPLIVGGQDDRVLVLSALCRCHDFVFVLETESQKKDKRDALIGDKGVC